MIIKPLRGWRPRPDLAARIPSYPYDVVSSEEARQIARGDEYSFLHVVRPEIDLGPGVDPYDSSVYERGRQNLQAMFDAGWLLRDEKPAYYVYQLVMGEHRQTGIVGASAVDDYLAGRIKKHEHTRPDKQQDRVRLVDALGVHPGPVFLTYRGLPELNAVVRGTSARDATVRFTAPDGIEHALWVVSDPTLCRKIEQLLGSVPASYVADGHHRAAAAAAICAKRREAHPGLGPEAPCNYFLTVLFPAEELKVLDYNRVVSDLNGLSPEMLLERLRQAGFDVEEGHGARRPPHRQSFGMYLDGSWYLLTADASMARGHGVAERLDVSVLTRHVLQPILGIGDLRTDKRIDFVGGIRGMDELENRVGSGDAAVAFALYPTSLDDVMRVADAGEVMPPKSTWFEPKLRSGLVVQALDGDTL